MKFNCFMFVSVVFLAFSPNFIQAAPGDLDPTFGFSGKITVTPGYSVFATSAAVQSDDKIVTAGGNKLVRFTPNDLPDQSFGSGGFVTAANFSFYDVKIQPDGKIVAGGSAKIGNYFGGSNQRFALARFNYNGSLDTTFGSGGKVTTSFGILSNDLIRSIALQTDGRIAAAGYQGESVNNNNFALARYNTNGTPDTSFSGDGRLTTDFYGENDYANAIAIQSDGKIVAAGDALNGNFYNIALARYLP